jgi:endoglucanase
MPSSRTSSIILYLVLFMSILLQVAMGFTNSSWAETTQLRRGVNLGLWLSQVDISNKRRWENKITASDFQKIHAKGFDHVRVPVSPYFFISKNGTVNQENFAFLDRMIKLASKNDLKFIIDVHPGPVIYEETVETAKFKKLWGTIAKHYQRYDGHVAYEILNEPTDKTKPSWKSFHQAIISEIRKNDKKHSIIVDLYNYTYVKNFTAISPFQDNNVIYSFHFYEPMIFTHQGADWSKEYGRYKQVNYPPNPPAAKVLSENWTDPKYLRYLVSDYNAKRIEQDINYAVEFRKRFNVPVYCGELGVLAKYAPVDSRKRWFKDVITALEQQQIGYALWNYNDAAFAIDDLF